MKLLKSYQALTFNTRCVAIAVLMAFLYCGDALAQKKVRIQPSLGGSTSYEAMAPHDKDALLSTVKNMMQSVPNKESLNYCTVFNFGDDEIMNTEANDMLINKIDNGNTEAWYGNYDSFLNSSRSGNLYLKAWYFIYLANSSLAHLDELTDCTPEQKKEIEGDLYFMRAWWHQELFTYFGEMPYVDYELAYDEIVKLSCPSAKECAEKCAADFAHAAELLPEVGTVQSNEPSLANQSEAPNRLAALAYKGKVLLWAASPLNHNGAQKGALENGKTYSYDTELAEKSADALGAALTLARGEQSHYKLTGTEQGQSIYENLFYTVKKNWLHPGAKEAVFSTSNQEQNGSNWNFSKLWGPKLAGLVAHDNIIHQPTANYINYAYGMANGLPITDPDSGFDPEHPFKDRDPRFYNDIVYDGYKYVTSTDRLNYDQKQYVTMNLYTGGNVRDEEKGSRTGYFCKKLVPTECNEGDRYYDWDYSLQCNLPYMRLADIYLMYAEACAAYGSASTSKNCTLTAEDAVNVLRDRAGAGHVAEKYTRDSKLFMDEVRRERACELAFEGHRWSDLSRWLLLTEEPYVKKTSQEFQRVTNARRPSDNKISDWSESVILTRQLDEASYTFPLMPNTPMEIDIIYSEDGKTLVYYPGTKTDETFVVPETVEHIGENCFAGCSKLTNIVLHDGIKSFGAGAFAGTSITEILLPSAITSLPDECFSHSSIKRFITASNAKGAANADEDALVIPARLKSLGTRCFAGRREKVIIEDGVESLGDYCFLNNICKEIYVPASVNHIGNSCFMPKEATDLVPWATILSPCLERITVDPNNKYYTDIDGVLYDKEKTHLMQCPSRYRGELNIPEGVIAIDENAVYNDNFITKVTLPSTIKSIHYSNFNRCMQLTDLVINATELPEWEVYVSNFMSSGYNLYVPAEALETYKNALGQAYMIYQILPIGAETTYADNDFVIVSLDNGILLDNTYLIEHIKEIYADGEKKDISSVMRQDGSLYFSNTEVVLKMDDGFTEIPADFNWSENKFILPNTVKKINGKVVELYEIPDIRQIVLPESLEELGENSLYGLRSWTLNIPKNVKTIGKGSLVKAQLAEITVDPDNLYFTAVDGVLYDKDVKTLVYFPAMKQDANYVVPETVEEIRDYAMSDPSLYNPMGYSHGTLTLPASLKRIGERAFVFYSPEAVFCYAKEVPQCGEHPFGETWDGLYHCTLYVPAASLEAYKADSEWGRFVEILPIEGIDGIELPEADMQKDAKVVSIYGIDGIQRTGMRKGINILRMSNGTAKTVIIR